MAPPPDYIVELRIRNGYMRKKMIANNYYSNAELSRASGVSQSLVGRYMNLKEAPVKKSGEWSAGVEKIALALLCSPEDLFPPQHLEEPLKKNKAELEMNLDQALAISNASPEDLMIAQESRDRVQQAINSLNPRTAEAIQEYFFEDMTYDQISENLRVSGNRVHQIVKHGIRDIKQILRRQRSNELISDFIKGAK